VAGSLEDRDPDRKAELGGLGDRGEDALRGQPTEGTGVPMRREIPARIRRLGRRRNRPRLRVMVVVVVVMVMVVVVM